MSWSSAKIEAGFKRHMTKRLLNRVLCCVWVLTQLLTPDVRGDDLSPLTDKNRVNACFEREFAVEVKAIASIQFEGRIDIGGQSVFVFAEGTEQAAKNVLMVLQSRPAQPSTWINSSLGPISAAEIGVFSFFDGDGRRLMSIIHVGWTFKVSIPGKSTVFEYQNEDVVNALRDALEKGINRENGWTSFVGDSQQAARQKEKR